MLNAIYWYGSIFGWLFLTGIGLPPVPEEAGILYAASTASLHPEVWWSVAWAACGLGIIAADSVLYGIGRGVGPKLFEYRWVQKVLNAEKRKRLESRFEEHGIKLLILARFLPPMRTGVFLIAGATRFSFLKFLVADLIYAVVGVGLLFFFGAAIMELLKQFKSTVVFIIAFAVMCYGLYMYYRILRGRESKYMPQAPLSILIQGAEGSAPDGGPTKDASAAPAAAEEAKVALGK